MAEQLGETAHYRYQTCHERLKRRCTDFYVSGSAGLGRMAHPQRITLVKTIFKKIVEINQSLGIKILLVEQNANLALEVSHYGYVLETGRIILHDRSSALRANERVKSAYLGGG